MSEMTIKIHAGTGKLTGESLCKSCSYSVCWTDHRGDHTRCTMLGGQVTENVFGKTINCNSYYNRTLPRLEDFEKTAWVLRTEKDGRQIGFSPPPKDEVNKRFPPPPR